jgi:hypothetical protein
MIWSSRCGFQRRRGEPPREGGHARVVPHPVRLRGPHGRLGPDPFGRDPRLEADGLVLAPTRHAGGALGSHELGDVRHAALSLPVLIQAGQRRQVAVEVGRSARSRSTRVLRFRRGMTTRTPPSRASPSGPSPPRASPGRLGSRGAQGVRAGPRAHAVPNRPLDALRDGPGSAPRAGGPQAVIGPRRNHSGTGRASAARVRVRTGSRRGRPGRGPSVDRDRGRGRVIRSHGVGPATAARRRPLLVRPRRPRGQSRRGGLPPRRRGARRGMAGVVGPGTTMADGPSRGDGTRRHVHPDPGRWIRRLPLSSWARPRRDHRSGVDGVCLERTGSDLSIARGRSVGWHLVRPHRHRRGVAIMATTRGAPLGIGFGCATLRRRFGGHLFAVGMGFWLPMISRFLVLVPVRVDMAGQHGAGRAEFRDRFRRQFLPVDDRRRGTARARVVILQEAHFLDRGGRVLHQTQ